MKTSIMKKNIEIYLLSYALTTIATSFPHAVLTIILFQKALSLSQIMIVQATYSAAVLLFEYPSGLLADMYSKKKLFIISRILLLGMMLIIIFMSGLLWMCLAWFIYGISSALDSGTLDADIINSLKALKKDNKLSKFISLSNQLDFISLLVGSTIGSWFYYLIGIKFYFIGIGLTILSIVFIISSYKEFSNIFFTNKTNIITEIKKGFNEVRQSTDIRIMIALTFVSQFFFQAHYQLWQGLFLYKNFNKRFFYIFYIIFQLISFMAYSINIDLKKSKKRLHFYISLGIIILITSTSILYFTSSYVFLCCYLVLIFLFTVLEYYCSILFSSAVSMERISSITSLRSSIGRIAAILSMLLSGFLLTKINVLTVVIANFGISILLILVMLILFRFGKKRINNKYFN